MSEKRTRSGRRKRERDYRTAVEIENRTEVPKAMSSMSIENTALALYTIRTYVPEC